MKSLSLIEEENKTLKSEIRQLCKRLDSVEKNKTEFLANIKNQMNNPLNSIIVLSEYLKQKLTENNEDKEIIDLIYRETVNLSFGLGNLVLAGEIEAGETIIEPSTFYVRELIEEAVKLFGGKIEEKGLATSIKCPASLKIHTDKSKLFIVMQNLLSNAIEFNVTSGDISISASKENGSGTVCISITDTGIGFPEKNADLMFMRFKQLQSGPDRQYVSGGIGLCIVKDIIELLGGHLEYKSKLGESSTFKIALPKKTAKRSLTLEENDVLFDMLVNNNAEF